MCITEFNEKVYTEGIRSEVCELIFAIQDYINDNPTISDSEVAARFDCNEILVKEARKRIIQ